MSVAEFLRRLGSNMGKDGNCSFVLVGFFSRFGTMIELRFGLGDIAENSTSDGVGRMMLGRFACRG
jgi:hypothetical protein